MRALTTRLPSPWNTSLLWPSEDARVLPTLRDWPADSEVTVCACHKRWKGFFEQIHI